MHSFQGSREHRPPWGPHHKASLISKQEQIGTQGSTISAHMNPNYLSIQLGAKLNKNVVQQKSLRISNILTRRCVIFFSFSEVENAFLSLHAR